MERAGLAAEVIFPEFGIPFELYNPRPAAIAGYRRTRKQIVGSYKAYNRRLAGLGIGPQAERFAGQALISFDDVDEAMKEIR